MKIGRKARRLNPSSEGNERTQLGESGNLTGEEEQVYSKCSLLG
jgi:hypothetical protein